tara:strand:- start:1133 stop:2062 length:930 start_codon:yes stop_codon:yes gene_type:complete
MKLKKPKFWDEKYNLITLLLVPLTIIFYFLTIIIKKITTAKKFKIPVICIGNIYLGGTGKTPLAIKINNILKKERKPIIVKKYYEDQVDEQLLIKKRAGNLITHKKRDLAIKLAENESYDVVILDDGLQDHGIHKNCNIVCFNNKQKIGNGFIFPAGPLREKFSSLVNANIVIINGERDESFEKKIRNVSEDIEIFYSNYVAKNLDEFKNEELLAFAGIGNPKNFFSLLEKSGLVVKKKIYFPDHYNYTKQELLDIIMKSKKDNYKIITTEKDFCRIEKFRLKEINFLEIDILISNEDKLISKIKENIV